MRVFECIECFVYVVRKETRLQAKYYYYVEEEDN